MSVEASAYVWKRSPFQGNALVTHLAIADVVNDAHGNEFWMTLEALAEKARCSRTTVSETLRTLYQIGGLEVVERGGGRGRATRYRFLMPPDGLKETSRIPDGNGAPGLPTTTRIPDGNETVNQPESAPKPTGIAVPIGITQENGNTKGAPRSESVDNRRAPDPDCVSCHGSGSIYSATAGADITCPCVADPHYEPTPTPTPMPAGLDHIERLRERRDREAG